MNWRDVKRAAEHAENEYAVLAYLVCFIAAAAALASLWA